MGNGVTDETLAKIYNVFDLYVQCANSEGFGLPQVEAAACGVPVACTNYSAMADIVNKLDAYPIGYETYKELETGCNRAVPIIDDIKSIFHKFLTLSDKEKECKRKEIRRLFEENYSWDATADKWMKIADDCNYANWKQPAKIIHPHKVDMKQPSNSQFMNQLISAYCYYEPHKYSLFYRSLLTDLRRGSSKSIWDAFYVSEFSPFSSNKPRAISRNDIAKVFEARLKNYNAWEEVRTNKSKLIDGEEKWLN